MAGPLRRCPRRRTTAPSRLLGLWLVCLVCCPAGFARAQGTDTLHAARHATWFQEGWRCLPADDPAFAASAFDDAGWPACPSLLRSDSLAGRPWPGVAWFRTRVVVDSTLRRTAWQMTAHLHGAAEVYLDGMLIQRYGVVSADPAAEVRVTDREPRDLPLTPGTHTLAVRFSNTQAAAYLGLLRFFGFELHVGTAAHIAEDTAKMHTNALFGMFFAGLYVAFALMHFMLYAAYPHTREHLYFSVLLLSIAVLVFSDFDFHLFTHSADTLLFIPRLFPTSVIVATLAGVGFLRLFFLKRLPRSFYAAAAVGAGLAVWSWWAGLHAYYPAVALFSLAGIADTLHVIGTALYRRMPGARLVGLGVGALVLGFTVPLLEALELLPLERPPFLPYVMSAAMLVAISIYLARTFAQTNRDLRRQLRQVRDLSEEKLAQERKAHDEAVQRKVLEVEYGRKVQELEEARALQLSMLPASVPDHPHLDIAAYMKTAAEVGGDYYDFACDGDGTLTLAIGDATGHGMKAGTMVTATKSLFNALGEEEDLLQILSRATHALKRLNLRKLYMALTLARYRADMLHVVAAGMPPVLVYRHATGRVERVVLKGMPLGSFPDFPYREAALPLGPRDTVLFMSDGFTELFNEAREELGFERAAAVFADVAREDPDTIIAALNAHAHTWTGGGAPHDDMTFVVLKRRAEVKTRGVRPPALAPPPVVPADVAP